MNAAEKLDLKPFEILTATEVFQCNCGRRLPKGAIYIQINEVALVNNEFTVRSRKECLHRCSALDRDVENTPRRIKVIRPEWDELPDNASEAQRSHFPIVNLRDERISNGYSAILELAEDRIYLECENSQVVTKLFAIDRSIDDAYGYWVQMKTPTGFFGRLYKEARSPFRKDCWYFALHLVKPVNVKAAAAR